MPGCKSQLLPVFSGLFVATLLISNTIAGKLISLGPLTVAAGIILFPLAYVFSDILTEVYGYAATRRILWTGIAAQLLMVFAFHRFTTLGRFWLGLESSLGNHRATDHHSSRPRGQAL